MNKKNNIGICKLTLEEGKFIKSHLIPQSVTKPSTKGAPLMQFNPDGSRPIRRWSSWYDKELVIQKGEDILTKHDTWAIKELRNKKLIWSSWGSSKVLDSSLHQIVPGQTWGIRTIEGINPKKLRLFYLSLLWRAASTSLPEFGEIQLSEGDLEKLRLMLINDNPEPLSFYPTSLVQLSTIGVIQNHTPFSDIKHIPSMQGTEEQNLPIFRFYFDGLIAHIHNHSSDNGETDKLKSLMVGAERNLAIVTQTYENSFQRYNLAFTLSKNLQN